MGKEKRWFPLESNPSVMNEFIQRLGFPVSKFSFCDVLSTEEWALDMVPQPVLGVLLLYPIKEATEEFSRKEAEEIDEKGQIVAKDLYYMKQTVGNACGTIGILHAIGNARATVELEDDTFLGKFLQKTVGKTPEEIASVLEEDDEIESTHHNAATEGQSEQLKSEMDPMDNHFICFTHVDGHLYELDGRKRHPVNHGKTDEFNFLKDACKEISKFMQRDPDEMRFTIVALAKTSDSDSN